MKKNKILIFLLLIAIIGVVGITIAYFSNSTSLENEFNTKEYGTTYTEEFVSPSNWLPGDTTLKTVTVTNSGQVDQAVRISLTETWTPKNSNETLTGWIHADGTKSNHTTEEELATDERAAVINFTENSDWTKVGDYYYYNYKLAPGQTTDSLIESVTFNALTKLGDTCTPSTNNGTTTITCNSSGSDYDHATYKLTINIETVQYNKYKEAWGVDVATLGMRPMTAQQFISKANPVSVTNYTDGDVHEMYTFEHEATEQTPALTDYRYIGDDPYNYVYFNCDDLNNQNSENCEVWRIIGVFDVEDEVGNWETRYKLARGNAFSEEKAWNSSLLNDWSISDLNSYLNDEFYNSFKTIYQKIVGDSKYYLGTRQSSYPILPSYGTTEEMYSWERGIDTYSESESCTYYPRNECGLRAVEWVGKVGLFYPSDEYMVYSKGINNDCYDDPSMCHNFFNDKNWIVKSNVLEGNTNSTYVWFISPHKDYDSVLYSRIYLGNDHQYLNHGVRPVLYLKSNVKLVDGNGSENNPYWLSYDSSDMIYTTYTKGQTITYDNQEYYVMNDSEGNKSYVKLLKKEPLTANEINSYNTNYTSTNGEYPYLENSNCTIGNTSNCSTNYNSSSIKTIIDNWSSSYNNDLVNINGYKARLVNNNDIMDYFAYESYYASPHNGYRASSDTPEWAYINGSKYWSMTVSEDSSSQVYGVSNTLSSENVYNKLYIRPVINLKKCAITNTCE